MKEITCAFTDPYGVHHESAICVIQSAARDGNYSESIYFDAAEGKYTTDSNSYDRATYSVSYWHSKQAKEDNAVMLDLPSTADAELSFSVTDEYRSLSLEEMVIKHFEEVLLPAMNGSIT